jgi:alkanesulfonate monooxygenase SsuD/methylene tetrahydromethanopterin reductase-like flavin-dependent oxidoreductase (luciferase family)
MRDPLFGVGLSPAAVPGADPAAAARRAEELGLDFVSAPDHLHGASPSFEPWTMLSWAAAATTRISVATRVLGLPYRAPPVVAKMAETLDRLSGGRLILGLGGGYSDEEFRAFGLEVPSPREKVDGLEEEIRLIRGLWSEPALTFEGRRYRTERAELQPKPGHHIPVWLGTYGPRALAVTGRLADGWIPSLGFAPPEQVVVLRERVLEAARDAGRDPDEIRCVYNLEVTLDAGAEARPSLVSGSIDQVIERLGGFLGLGFTGLNFILSGPDPAADLERLGAEVLPALRGGG